MAVSVPSGSKGGKRSLDADINLVPFIDLLSMCICFLLMTAVWVQTAGIDVKQSHGTSAPQAKNDKPVELDVKFLSGTSMEISVKQGSAGKKTKISAENTAALTVKAATELQGMLSRYDATALATAQAKITPHAAVSYGDLVSLMDAIRKNKVTNLGVIPTGVN